MNPAELNMQLPGHLINYATNVSVFMYSLLFYIVLFIIIGIIWNF